MCRVIAIFFSIFISISVLAQNNSIVAIIDNIPITSKELQERIKMEECFLKIQKHNNINIDSKTILNQLINEILITEKGKSFGIYIDSEELNLYISKIEEMNKLSKGSLKSILQNNNIDFSTYQSKIRSDVIFNKISQEIWKSIPKALDSDMYAFILDSNNINILVKYKTYSSKDLKPKNFNELLKLKKKIKDCNYRNSISNSIKIKEDEVGLLTLDRGLKTLLSDARENIPTNIIKKQDHFEMYLVCAKTFPYINSSQEGNIKYHINIQNMKEKAGKLIEQWRNSSSIKILLK